MTPQLVAVRDEEDARTKTRALIDAGVDVVKIFNQDQMSPAECKAIVAEAHRRGLKTAAHGTTDTDIRVGLECGIDDFQHSGRERPNSRPISWLPSASG